MAKRWLVRETVSDDLVEQLLYNRRVSQDVSEQFLNPNYARDLGDPFLLPDMERAVERLLAAFKNHERVMIAGDYDADGVLASALLASFFQKIGFDNFSVYLPNRHNEKYGLSDKVIQQALAERASLLITVDCGVSNAAEIARAGELGIETIVTDHHLPPAVLPPALAVLNPKRVGSLYPFAELCGTAVAFKLVQALLARGQFGLPLGWEKWLLDLVALATVADMMPLVGENRALVHFGLKVLQISRRPGVVALARHWRLPQAFLTEDDIAFVIGPRLNAAGRMSHASEAYRLLITADSAEAETLAAHLETKNQERRVVVAEIFAAARGRLTGSDLPPVLVLGDESWSPAVVGLAASRLAEEFNRPTFVWGSNGGGEIKGSCRSVGDVNIVELMRLAQAERELFADYGGHAMAGGFSLTGDRLPLLAAALLAAHRSLIKNPSVAELLLEIDAELPPAAADAATAALLERLAPFGSANPKPVFLFRNLELIARRHFGQNEAHQELQFAELAPRALGFFYRLPPAVTGRPGERVDLAASLETSFFRGRPELRLRIADLRPAGLE